MITVTDNQRMILRERNINFSVFKLVISALLTNANLIDEDSWTEFYEDFVEGIDKYEVSIEEFAEFHFLEFSEEKHNYWLRSRENSWVDARTKPPFNVSVLVFIPEEDNHKTAGMWDISEKWTLLDEYRSPKGKVTHWRKMPDDPITKS